MDLPYYFGLPRGAKLALISFRALKGHTINISEKKACGRNVKVNLLGHWTSGLWTSSPVVKEHYLS